jgi:molybdenum cofactor synthesis domain-containing protein
MNPPEAPLTVGVALIGDEILAAQISESNGAWMLGRLRQLGARPREVCILPDDPALIAEAVARMSARWQVVLTSGGVGPTHDDITMEAVAAAFGVGLAVHPQMEAWLCRRFQSDPGGLSVWLRMARLPRGAQLIWSDDGQWPLCQVQNVYVMPGSPPYMKRQFEVIAPRLRCADRAQVRWVYFKAQEGALAPLLEQVVAAHPQVKVGSYPAVRPQPWQVRVSLESCDGAALEEAAEALRRLAQPWWVGMDDGEAP